MAEYRNRVFVHFGNRKLESNETYINCHVFVSGGHAIYAEGDVTNVILKGCAGQPNTPAWKIALMLVCGPYRNWQSRKLTEKTGI